MSALSSSSSTNPDSSAAAELVYLDIDINSSLAARSNAALFVSKTNSRYSLSSNDIRRLGGSELSRLPDLFSCDHDFSHLPPSKIDFSPPSSTSNCRLVLRLFSSAVPLACENFVRLAAGSSPSLGDCGKPLAYVGSSIHRVVPGFVVQGGDFVFGNGSGGESAFPGKRVFKDEKAGLQLKHDKRGVLSMGNSGKNSNSSQFFLTFAPCPNLDGKHVVFGELLHGNDVLGDVERRGTSEGTPTCPLTILSCGRFDFDAAQDCGPSARRRLPSAGYWLDLPDGDAYLGYVRVFHGLPRVLLVGPSQMVVDKLRSSLESSLRCASVEQVIVVPSEDDDAKLIADLLKKVQDGSADVAVVAPACIVSDPEKVMAGVRGGEVVLCKPVEVAAIFAEGGRFGHWVLDRKRP